MTYLQVHVLYVDGHPGDGVLGDNRSVSDRGGHREIESAFALAFVQGVVGSTPVQIQIGGQHVVEQIGRGTACELDVELGVGREHWGCLIKLAVTQQVLSISRAESSEGLHGKGQQETPIFVQVKRMSCVRTGKQRFLMHVGQGFRHQQITRQ